MATKEVNALLLLPANEDGHLTTIEGTDSVPWEPDDPSGFTVHELGQRFRRKMPVVDWLRERGLEIEVVQTNGIGTFFRLTSEPDREDKTPTTYKPATGDDPTWWRR